MKICILVMPNEIPDAEIVTVAKELCESFEIDSCVHILDQKDLMCVPNRPTKTPIMELTDRIEGTCGNGNSIQTMRNVRNAVINHGDINEELLNAFTSKLTRRELAYLEKKHLEWLPKYLTDLKSILL